MHFSTPYGATASASRRRRPRRRERWSGADRSDDRRLCGCGRPDVTVSDESVAQCIWELRQKLGDRDHKLIKTVARRGYLLNAVVAEEPQPPRPDAPAGMAAQADPGGSAPGTGQIRPHNSTTMRSGVLWTQLGAFQWLARLPGQRKALSLGVAAGLLLVAWLIVHLLGGAYRGDADRRKQAVVDIFVRAMGSPIFGPAYHALYDADASKVLAMPVAEFDVKVAQLSDIFWAVGVCVSAGQCDEHLARKVFCHDFKTYEFAYNVTHAPGQRWQTFDDEALSVFCGCENKHRFAGLKDRPPPWPGCGRKVG